MSKSRVLGLKPYNLGKRFPGDVSQHRLNLYVSRYREKGYEIFGYKG